MISVRRLRKIVRFRELCMFSTPTARRLGHKSLCMNVSDLRSQRQLTAEGVEHMPKCAPGTVFDNDHFDTTNTHVTWSVQGPLMDTNRDGRGQSGRHSASLDCLDASVMV